MDTYHLQMWRGNWSPKCQIQWKVIEAFWRGWAGFCTTCMIKFSIVSNLLGSLLLCSFAFFFFNMLKLKIWKLFIPCQIFKGGISVTPREIDIDKQNCVSVILIIFSFRVKKNEKLTISTVCSFSQMLWFGLLNLRLDSSDGKDRISPMNPDLLPLNSWTKLCIHQTQIIGISLIATS